MTLNEMRICYKDYARKERELEELDQLWAPRIIQQIVDKAARDGTKESTPDASLQLGRGLTSVTRDGSKADG